MSERDRFYEAKAIIGSQAVELGVVRISEGKPSTFKDLGNNLEFRTEDENYRISIDITGERLDLGKVSFKGSTPDIKRTSDNYLTLEEISQQEASLFGIKNALRALYDEIHGK